MFSLEFVLLLYTLYMYMFILECVLYIYIYKHTRTHTHTHTHTHARMCSLTVYKGLDIRCLSVCLSIYLLSVCLSVYLSAVCLFVAVPLFGEASHFFNHADKHVFSFFLFFSGKNCGGCTIIRTSSSSSNSKPQFLNLKPYPKP